MQYCSEDIRYKVCLRILYSHSTHPTQTYAPHWLMGLKTQHNEIQTNKTKQKQQIPFNDGIPCTTSLFPLQVVCKYQFPNGHLWYFTVIGVLLNQLVIFLIIYVIRFSGHNYLLNDTSTFERCQHDVAAVTLVKYECHSKGSNVYTFIDLEMSVTRRSDTDMRQ